MIGILSFIKMARIIFISLVLTTLTACSTSSPKKNSEKNVNDEFSWIENSDFKAPIEIPFDPSDDWFKDGLATTDILARESLARLPKDKIMVAGKSNNEVTKLISLCYQRRFTDAFKKFNKNYFKYKNNASYLNQIGTCYLLKGENRKALLFYNKSRDLKKKYTPPINNIGVLYERMGKDQKALSAYKRAYDINGFSLTPLFNLGHLYLKYHLFQDAIKVFRSLVKQNNKDIDAVTGLATAYMMAGEFNNSVKFFSSISRDLYRHPRLGVNFSYSLFMVGRKKDGQAVYNSIDISKSTKLSAYYSKVGSLIGVK